MRTLTLLTIVALLWSAPLGAQEKSEPKEKPVQTTVAAILKDPDNFHKKLVQVEGKVSDIKKRTSRASRDCSPACL